MVRIVQHTSPGMAVGARVDRGGSQSGIKLGQIRSHGTESRLNQVFEVVGDIHLHLGKEVIFELETLVSGVGSCLTDGAKSGGSS